jgi:hypothetical protein
LGTPEEKDEELEAEEKLENEIATEVSTLIRRVLDGIRTYPPGHVTLKGYYQSLLEKLEAQVKSEEDEYALRVTPMGFATSTAIVNRAEKLQDSITHPLYLDGVMTFSVERGVNLEELVRLMEMWRKTLDGQLGETHTFSTRFWEADFQTLSVVSVESFSEKGAEADPKKASNTLQAVVDELSGIAPKTAMAPVAGTAGVGRGTKLVRVAKEDLTALRAMGISEMTEKDLERHDAAERAPVAGMTPAEAAAVIAELKKMGAHAVERALDAVFVTALRATVEEQERLRTAFGLVLGAMLTANQLERLKTNLLRQVEHARAGNPAHLEARFAVLGRLMSALAAPQILEPTVAALDDEAKRALAAGLLKFLPTNRAPQALLEWIVVPQTPAGLRALSDHIATLKLEPNDVALRLSWSDEELALELLHIAKALGVNGWPVRKAALAHPSVSAQAAAVKGLDRDQLLAHRLELLPLLFSPVAEIRNELFAPFVASRDKGVAPALATLLRRVQIDPAERKRVLVALGTLGGPEAGGALRGELTNLKDVDLQCVAAHALGVAGDEKARPQLEALAGKFLGGGPLKQAAKDALRRLDAMKAGKPA